MEVDWVPSWLTVCSFVLNAMGGKGRVLTQRITVVTSTAVFGVSVSISFGLVFVLVRDIQSQHSLTLDHTHNVIIIYSERVVLNQP